MKITNQFKGLVVGADHLVEGVHQVVIVKTTIYLVGPEMYRPRSNSHFAKSIFDGPVFVGDEVEITFTDNGKEGDQLKGKVLQEGDSDTRLQFAKVDILKTQLTEEEADFKKMMTKRFGRLTKAGAKVDDQK